MGEQHVCRVEFQRLTEVVLTWDSFSTGAIPVSRQFYIGLEVAELGLTLFMIGSVSLNTVEKPKLRCCITTD
jgi:hypothetical protein